MSDEVSRPPEPLPAFSVRISARAKHPRLRVLPGKGLEVVLPRHMPPETATTIVEQHKAWVRKTLAATNGAPTPAATVPKVVSLCGGTENLTVVCHGEDAPETDAANLIRLRAPRMNTAAALQELQEWVRRHAAAALGEETGILARRHALAYTALRFRRQKTRWGSCTAKGALSLNICLVFLPVELARHVILHELAHTRHLNHGRGFWKTLFGMEPNALNLDKRLRAAWRYVPDWIW